MKKKFFRNFILVALVSAPLLSQAQAHCKIMMGVVISYGGYELHIEKWCCTGPEGCFEDVYIL